MQSASDEEDEGHLSESAADLFLDGLIAASASQSLPAALNPPPMTAILTAGTPPTSSTPPVTADGVIVTSKGNVIHKITFDNPAPAPPIAVTAAPVVKTTVTGKQLRKIPRPVAVATEPTASTTPAAGRGRGVARGSAAGGVASDQGVATPVVGRGRGVARGGAATGIAPGAAVESLEGIARGAASALRSVGLGQRGKARTKARGAKK